jgi:hypothetical protein
MIQLSILTPIEDLLTAAVCTDRSMRVFTGSQ